jgi:predicted pyridoxine 5'-phosphate oxidase superfamily flavin-nucleotide-binding protein
MTNRPNQERAVPWHIGEKAMQRTIGADALFAGLESRIFHTQLSEQQRLFFSGLRLIVIGSVDGTGNPWTTVVTGNPGSLSSPDIRTLQIHSTMPDADPVKAGIHVGASVALLGIDFETRRRYRLNGKVIASTASQTDVRTLQVFGNCPRYIKIRDFLGLPASPASAERPDVLTRLDDEGRFLVKQAETFFVASYVDLDTSTRLVDVSHRGGPKGFVVISDDGSLTVPDYPGNRFFNTLGNFVLNPIAGLTFIDFDEGALLQLSGTVELLLDDPRINEYPGAERLWRFTPRVFIRRHGAIAFQRPGECLI